MIKLCTLGGLATLLVTTTPAVATCYNVDKGQPATLEGVLRLVVFPGPPNYYDVRTGDVPEIEYILKLHRPICISESTDPTGGSPQAFDEVQLVPKSPAISALMHDLRGDEVTATLTDQMSAITAHHKRPLVAWVVDIAETYPIKSDAYTDDYLAQYDTAATVVRAFYQALSVGEGDTAASLVLPEKREGAFSATRLTSFYGSLYRSLSLISLKTIDATHFEAHYFYIEAMHEACDGRAQVTTKEVDGLNYVASIRALDGC